MIPSNAHSSLLSSKTPSEVTHSSLHVNYTLKSDLDYYQNSNEYSLTIAANKCADCFENCRECLKGNTCGIITTCSCAICCAGGAILSVFYQSLWSSLTSSLVSLGTSLCSIGCCVKCIKLSKKRICLQRHAYL